MFEALLIWRISETTLQCPEPPYFTNIIGKGLRDLHLFNVTVFLHRVAWILLVLALPIETAEHPSIIAPPSDVTGKLGGTAKFKCEVKFGSIRVMSWEFNNKIIYSLSFEHEDYPLGTARYSVAKDGGTFTLTVRDICHSDAGKYTCRVLDKAEDASLNVIEAPETSILTPPSDVTGKLSGTAEFSCEVQFTSIEMMQWDFRQKVVYTLEFDYERFPKGESKYSVVRIGRTFILTVKDLQYSDSGVYTCRVFKHAETANLIVAGTPKLSFSTSIAVEGSRENYTCSTPFTGLWKEKLAPGHYPQLLMFFDGKPLNGRVTEEHVEGLTVYYYKLTQTYHLTLQVRMHGKILTCAIRSSSPAMQLNTTTTVNVLYSVRNVYYTPERESYEVGTVINCMADGNPKPNFQWVDANADVRIYGNALVITKDMVGSNTWTCTARNTINMHPYRKSVIAEFDVVFPENILEETINTHSSKLWNDALKIAVGVAVSVCTILIFAAAVYCYYRNKRG